MKSKNWMFLWAFAITNVVWGAQAVLAPWGRTESSAVSILAGIVMFVTAPGLRSGGNHLTTIFAVSALGLVFGGVFQLLQFEGTVLAVVLSFLVLFLILLGLKEVVTWSGRLHVVHGLVLMWGMIIGWKLTAVWALVLCIVWAWWFFSRTKEAREEEVEGLLRFL